ncbi:MAG: hypothetical protein COA52_16510 [Hyphomicrobiales bacterium]|nr:MAG: hypothetical protein COA52_16510 [Hyphomicrobiales bacterium]
MDTGAFNVQASDKKLLSDWQPHYKDLFGKYTIKLQHRLKDSGLFSEEVLGELIETYPRALYNLNTAGAEKGKLNWREGYLADTSGKDLIKAIKNGHLWLNLRRVMDVDKRYADLLQQIFDEFEDKVPGLHTFKQNMGILISSPNMTVPYHCDIPGQALWQIEGRKKVYIYPNRAPFLPHETLEGIILGETEEELSYHEWYDDHAEIHVLSPGEMALWDLNAPHRVVNEDCLNISVTTEHYTSDIRKSYAVNYANGVLRRRFGLSPATNSIGGLMPYPKAALTLLWKKLGLNKKHEVVKMVSFKPDPKADIGYVDVEPFVR